MPKISVLSVSFAMGLGYQRKLSKTRVGGNIDNPERLGYSFRMELTEAPKLIDPEKVTPTAAKSAYSTLKSDPKTKVLESPYPNADLVRSGERFAILDNDRQEITYYMEFKERDLEGHKAVYQNLVWRNATIGGTRGIAERMFFEQLLQIYGIITTDDIQTDLGKGFWRSAVGRAIEKNLHVYFFDLNQRANPKPIQTQSDLDDVVDLIWGKGEENRYRLIMISKKPFSAPVGIDIDEFGMPT